MASIDRTVFIVGNWKMYHTIETSLEFLEKLIPLVQETACHIYLAVPFTSIGPMVSYLKEKNSTIIIGAQNMNDASEGAFTGEIAGKMLKEAGAQFVILGHSERRRLFNEDNRLINAKVKRALIDGLQPILCLGENTAEREDGKTNEVLQKELSECLKDIPIANLNNVLISYEPLWAVGTDKPATPEIAEESHRFCRECVAKIANEETAQKMTILYGGSVKPDNVKALLEKPDINGVLIGGASLSVESFNEIIALAAVDDKSHHVKADADVDEKVPHAEVDVEDGPHHADTSV